MNEDLRALLNKLEKTEGMLTFELGREITRNTTLKAGQVMQLLSSCRHDSGNGDFAKLREALTEWERIEDMKNEWLFKFMDETYHENQNVAE